MEEKHLKPTVRMERQRSQGSVSDKGSHCSSSRTPRSSVGAAAARARARAEAARARATFAAKEIAIKVDKAWLEANLEALHMEKEAAVANTQAEILEAAVEQEGEELYSRQSRSVSIHSTRKRVRDYVRDQDECHSHQFGSLSNAVHEQGSVHSIQLTSHDSHNTLEKINDQLTAYGACFSPIHLYQRSEVFNSSQIALNSHSPVQHQIKTLLVKSEEIMPRTGSYGPNPQPKVNTPLHAGSPPAHCSEHSYMMNIAKYLACKELVSTGLSHFDDCPESYRAWKSAFINAIRDLDLTAGEELDLLSKWLGKESSEYVRRFRAVHISNPDAALRMTWDRLNENSATVLQRLSKMHSLRSWTAFPRFQTKITLN